MEQPRKVYQADLIELGWEYLTYHAEGWILCGRELPEDVKNFLAYCKEQDKEMMHCKRGIDGKSFYERREEAKKAVREKAKEYYERIKKVENEQIL